MSFTININQSGLIFPGLLLKHTQKQKMSKLETAMDSLIEVFQYYSSKEGDKFLLSRGELRNLLRGELSHYLQVLTVLCLLSACLTVNSNLWVDSRIMM